MMYRYYPAFTRTQRRVLRASWVLLAVSIVIIGASLALVMTARAQVTCEQVRQCVATYGRAACAVRAIAAGATKEQIEQARACLRSTKQ